MRSQKHIFIASILMGLFGGINGAMAEQTPDDKREKNVLDEQERQRLFQIEQARLAAKAEADRLERDKVKIDEERKLRTDVLRQREEAEKNRIKDLIKEELKKNEQEKVITTGFDRAKAQDMLKLDTGKTLAASDLTQQRRLYQSIIREFQQQDFILELYYLGRRLDTEGDGKYEEGRRMEMNGANRFIGAEEKLVQLQKALVEWRAKHNSGGNNGGVVIVNDMQEQINKCEREIENTKRDKERATVVKAEGTKKKNDGLQQKMMGLALFQVCEDKLRELGLPVPSDKAPKPAAETKSDGKVVKLKDGSSIKATKVMDMGDMYVVKDAEGKMSNIKKEDVDEIK